MLISHVLRGMLSLLALFLAAAMPAAAQQPVPSLSSQIRLAFFGEGWDDGRAEIATYDAVEVVRGRPRSHTARLITVAEEFNRQFYVKADWPHGDKPILPVVRQTHAATVTAAASPRHFAGSVFVERARPSRLLKMSLSTQQWDGVSFKEYHLWGERPIQLYHSPHDGEGSGERTLDTRGDAFFEEHLPLALRALDFRDGLVARFRLYSSQATAKAPEPRAVGARLAVTGREETWAVAISAEDGRTLEFEFARESPHHLLRFSHSDGREMTLRSAERDAYWEAVE